MLLPLLFFVLLSSDVFPEKVDALPKLNDTKAAEAFIDSAEVVVVGFLEGEQSRGYKKLLAAAQQVKTVPVAMCTVKEVWVDFNVTSESISLFRKADNSREDLILSQTKKLKTDGLVNFFVINEIRYITEYNQVTAVGLFNSEVKAHLLLFANEGSKEYTELRDRLRDLAPEFTGKFLVVLINGEVKYNSRSLEYFGLKSADLPRVGIYDGNSDMKWLLPEGEISTERVREFCQSFLRGELKEVHQAGETAKTEL
ncbi:endoplasmic reticulum resident protein 27 isoform X2 [Thalassophryne amazonica]|uniref:endoplasmic reticulum resident protein 27 isoform X2 n=1 Tax=Thalassophryne amazonica TaxID=390379 RepID=UPI0014723528|nr:endoplasmic reticulum resident protein 27 isoform X2 [Thalassophryne amazonica]